MYGVSCIRRGACKQESAGEAAVAGVVSSPPHHHSLLIVFRVMASYFDEHNCRPLGPGQTPDHFLHFARLMLHGGYWQDLQLEFTQLFGYGERPPPPASKEFIENMTTVIATKQAGQCPVCLKEWTEGEEMKELPCKHMFHSSCILPWLKKTNSCPMCRHELPTDDQDYEEYRKQKKRAKDREAEIETLHNSMFS